MKESIWLQKNCDNCALGICSTLPVGCLECAEEAYRGSKSGNWAPLGMFPAVDEDVYNDKADDL